MTAGAVIRGWRKKAGLTQTDVAVKAGLSLSTIQKIEASRHEPERPTLRAVVEALGKTLDALDEAAGAEEGRYEVTLRGEDGVQLRVDQGIVDRIAREAKAANKEFFAYFFDMLKEMGLDAHDDEEEEGEIDTETIQPPEPPANVPAKRERRPARPLAPGGGAKRKGRSK